MRIRSSREGPFPSLESPGVLTAGHAGETARVVEAVQSLAGVICPVHTFPTLHASSCRGDTERHIYSGVRGPPTTTTTRRL